MSSASPPLPQKKRWWRRRRTWLGIAILFLLAFAGLNGMAYIQARAMTHFVTGGRRTVIPEELSFAQKIKVLFTGVRIPRPANRGNPADFGLEFRTVRFGGAGNDDCEAWYIPCLDARGLCIAFPGYTSAKSTLLPAAKAFHEMGYATLLVDFRGCGGSRGDQTTVGYLEAGDVVAAVDFSKKIWPRQDSVILYGQSMGAAAALRAVAVSGVRPRAIIIESCFDTLLATAQNRFSAMGLPAFPLAQLLVFWGGHQQGYDGFKHNPADYAANVFCPVLLMQAGRDPRVTNQQAHNLFDHLAGPKKFEYFEDAGHCGFLGNDPTRWTNAIKSFLSQSPGPAH
jgi:hypothetical protein